ncbi:methyltransferase domain-containing protein [Pseudobutyrivibrio sp.]
MSINKENLESINKEYWLNRAPGYSEVNKEELEGIQHQNWKEYLCKQISERYSGTQPSEISILDVGAGPGFISIILAEEGYNVTAFDFAQSMIEEAKLNAAGLADRITFVQGDAMKLPFEADRFDVVFSRNLTWNLPHPDKAYDSWLRVLKPGGLMLVFDANWYTYLIDENKRAEYEKDRENVKLSSLGDYNIGENFDTMEQIALDMPLTHKLRPAWDMEYLNSIHAGEVSSVLDIGSILYSEKEKINYCSTPMFLVKVVKG